ncbi:hypothetical protein IWQ60_001507 [Tieghemiomyces parasiticus]|uniref:Uncharacterized protein n=1 Tax=Tieghemiomyces parasiticus TaxID=78921 RepID=A0A9W8E1V7_9FUNG|nr:hypothetical protein IWQ60_001507 [Tieghemiomyces parasiticus]
MDNPRYTWGSGTTLAKEPAPRRWLTGEDTSWGTAPTTTLGRTTLAVVLTQAVLTTILQSLVLASQYHQIRLAKSLRDRLPSPRINDMATLGAVSIGSFVLILSTYLALFYWWRAIARRCPVRTAALVGFNSVLTCLGLLLTLDIPVLTRPNVARVMATSSIQFARHLPVYTILTSIILVICTLALTALGVALNLLLPLPDVTFYTDGLLTRVRRTFSSLAFSACVMSMAESMAFLVVDSNPANILHFVGGVIITALIPALGYLCLQNVTHLCYLGYLATQLLAIAYFIATLVITANRSPSVQYMSGNATMLAYLFIAFSLTMIVGLLAITGFQYYQIIRVWTKERQASTPMET